MRYASAFKALGVAMMAVSVLLGVGVLTFAGPCIHDDGTVGACVSSAQGIMGAAVMLVGIALVELLVPHPLVRGICAALALALGLFALFAPGNALPLCMMQTMPCRAVMQPFAMVCGAAIVLMSAVVIMLAFRSR